MGRPYRPGKITHLPYLVERHGSAIEYDLLTLPGLTLPDVSLRANLRNRAVTWRRLAVILQNLPPGCAFHESLTGSRWTIADHLLADQFDLAAVAGGVTEQGSKKPIRARRPADVQKAAEQQDLRTRMAREQRARRQRRRQQEGGAGG
jgi:glutathione S-transferase